MKATAAAMRLLIAAAVCLIAVPTETARACCQLGGTACGDPFAVSCNNGVVCFSPWRTCAGCTCTTTNGGQTCLPTASEPGTVPTLLVGKHSLSPTDLDLSWGATCGSSGADYAVHQGQLGAWYSHAPLQCSTGQALSLTITPLSGNRYFLIAPRTAEFTGSLGVGAAGAERPDGEPSCTDDRALAPCP